MNFSSLSNLSGNSHLWMMLGVLMVAAGLLLAASAILLRAMRQGRNERMIDQVLASRQQQALAALRAASAPLGHRAAGDDAATDPGEAGEGVRRGWRAVFDRAAALGKQWSETRLGQHLIAAEDRLLLAQCGWDSVRAKSLFLFSRVALAVVLPLLVWLWFPGGGGLSTIVRLLGAVGVGLLAPKFYVQRKAAARRRDLIEELPLLIDLLRLLQGVGLSMDQSLYVMVSDFREVLPILSKEFENANRQYASGRGREASMGRLREVYDNDDLRALVRLIVQVEQHGGAVQEPLQQFSDRLREQRRQTMKERIGKLTVKMTLAMMLTLLPALMLVVAGPALLSLTKSMEVMQ
ncbi:pilus assembly protein TadC [Pandoraea pnomenusa]|jgi:tight adherence protein C|uniref:Pilus assembly protein TadC n=2 Tax=Pandoraea pnomenusa TaxID=93220 RepID=A0ABY6WEY7_9BURK|nr:MULTISPECIES: type II secretion system F family protein [Pandoraea]AHB05655.1 pilus assembly protein TadC [Pandoraea pnomenusa 3kgm]AHB78280.1 pilus assembly protein TadC [Pandoraea pnomenusa]AHN73424.2 pilus assembly protein TadC [Pandoraea pnomenusa]ANC43045.1 pilus assembly protein TadC [Pandoraea pnomenusa]VVE61947.1 pilus assembly protein TadC [Pandoraea pnomenusa]